MHLNIELHLTTSPSYTPSSTSNGRTLTTSSLILTSKFLFVVKDPANTTVRDIKKNVLNIWKAVEEGVGRVVEVSDIHTVRFLTHAGFPVADIYTVSDGLEPDKTSHVVAVVQPQDVAKVLPGYVHKAVAVAAVNGTGATPAGKRKAEVLEEEVEAGNGLSKTARKNRRKRGKSGRVDLNDGFGGPSTPLPASMVLVNPVTPAVLKPTPAKKSQTPAKPPTPAVNTTTTPIVAPTALPTLSPTTLQSLISGGPVAAPGTSKSAKHRKLKKAAAAAAVQPTITTPSAARPGSTLPPVPASILSQFIKPAAVPVENGPVAPAGATGTKKRKAEEAVVVATPVPAGSSTKKKGKAAKVAGTKPLVATPNAAADVMALKAVTPVVAKGKGKKAHTPAPALVESAPAQPVVLPPVKLVPPAESVGTVPVKPKGRTPKPAATKEAVPTPAASVSEPITITTPVVSKTLKKTTVKKTPTPAPAPSKPTTAEPVDLAPVETVAPEKPVETVPAKKRARPAKVVPAATVTVPIPQTTAAGPSEDLDATAVNITATIAKPAAATKPINKKPAPAPTVTAIDVIPPPSAVEIATGKKLGRPHKSVEPAQPQLQPETPVPTDTVPTSQEELIATPVAVKRKAVRGRKKKEVEPEVVVPEPEVGSEDVEDDTVEQSTPAPAETVVKKSRGRKAVKETPQPTSEPLEPVSEDVVEDASPAEEESSFITPAPVKPVQKRTRGKKGVDETPQATSEQPEVALEEGLEGSTVEEAASLVAEPVVKKARGRKPKAPPLLEPESVAEDVVEDGAAEEEAISIKPAPVKPVQKRATRGKKAVQETPQPTSEPEIVAEEDMEEVTAEEVVPTPVKPVEKKTRGRKPKATPQPTSELEPVADDAVEKSTAEDVITATPAPVKPAQNRAARGKKALKETPQPEPEIVPEDVVEDTAEEVVISAPAKPVEKKPTRGKKAINQASPAVEKLPHPHTPDSSALGALISSQLASAKPSPPAIEQQPHPPATPEAVAALKDRLVKATWMKTRWVDTPAIRQTPPAEPVTEAKLDASKPNTRKQAAKRASVGETTTVAAENDISPATTKAVEGSPRKKRRTGQALPSDRVHISPEMDIASPGSEAEDEGHQEAVPEVSQPNGSETEDEGEAGDRGVNGDVVPMDIVSSAEAQPDAEGSETEDEGHDVTSPAVAVQTDGGEGNGSESEDEEQEESPSIFLPVTQEQDDGTDGSEPEDEGDEAEDAQAAITQPKDDDESDASETEDEQTLSQIIKRRRASQPERASTPESAMDEDPAASSPAMSDRSPNKQAGAARGPTITSPLSPAATESTSDGAKPMDIDTLIPLNPAPKTQPQPLNISLHKRAPPLKPRTSLLTRPTANRVQSLSEIANSLESFSQPAKPYSQMQHSPAATSDDEEDEEDDEENGAESSGSSSGDDSSSSEGSDDDEMDWAFAGKKGKASKQKVRLAGRKQRRKKKSIFEEMAIDAESKRTHPNPSAQLARPRAAPAMTLSQPSTHTTTAITKQIHRWPVNVAGAGRPIWTDALRQAEVLRNPGPSSEEIARELDGVESDE